MHATLSNVRRLTRAELPLEGLTLVQGPNGAGKSSLALGIAACLTGTAAILTGRKGDDGRYMLADGCKEARASVSTGAGSVAVAWPKGEVAVTGEAPPRASRIALGLDQFPTMPAKDRATAFIAAFQSLPTPDDMAAELTRLGLDRATVTGPAGKDGKATKPLLVDELRKGLGAPDGWDAATKRCADTARKLKGSWEEVTGAKWGAKVAADWLPDQLRGVEKLEATQACSDRLYIATVETLKARDAAVGKSAVDQARRAELQALADDALAAQERFEAAGAKVAEATKAQADAHAALPNSAPRCPCPECGAEVEIHAHQLRKVSGPSASGEKLVELRRAVASADATLARLLGERGAAERTAQATADAADALRAMPPEPADADAIAAATKAYADADQRYQAFRGWCRARQIHAEITAWLTAGEVVGPEGLRKAKAQGVLAELNERLAATSEAMRCPAISLSADLEPLYGGAPYAALAGLSGVQSSAQWRVNAALALEIARADRSELVILDGADVLDSAGRDGLFRALRNCGLNVLVTMTMGSRDRAVNLPPRIGRSWWIEGGALGPVKVEMKEAA